MNKHQLNSMYLILIAAVILFLFIWIIVSQKSGQGFLEAINNIK